MSAASTLQTRLLTAAGWLLPALLVAIPVSTSIAEILFWIWIVAAVTGLGHQRLLAELRRPAGWISLAIFALAMIGLCWTIAPWKDALKHVDILFKFLVVPVLFAQMRVEPHVQRLAIAVLFVTGLIWTLSLLMLVFPSLWPPQEIAGVPFKNYASQSILFSLVAFCLAHWSAFAWRNGHRNIVVASLSGAILLIASVVFVSSSRTALLALLPLVVLFFFQWSGWRGLAVGIGAAAVLLAATWVASPHVRERAMSVRQEMATAAKTGEITSAGLRVVYWQKALAFIAERPILGHGTGSTRELYRRAATGTGVTADAPGDPHNQILAFEIPFGIPGVAAILALFVIHLLLFRGNTPVHVMGQTVVVLFVIVGLFNSPLMNFTESRIYFFAVGILGGLVLTGFDARRGLCNDRRVL